MISSCSDVSSMVEKNVMILEIKFRIGQNELYLETFLYLLMSVEVDLARDKLEFVIGKT